MGASRSPALTAVLGLCIGLAIAGCGSGKSETPLQEELKSSRVHSEEAIERQQVASALLDLGEGHVNEAKLALTRGCPDTPPSESFANLKSVEADSSTMNVAELRDALETEIC